LFERINQLHWACLSGTGRTELLKMLAFLGDYVKTHFREEEALMREHQCPASAKNKIAHAQFMRDFVQLVQTVTREGATTNAVVRLRQLLGDWLREHICTIDQEMRQCVSPAAKGSD
jgi:hemerythrin